MSPGKIRPVLGNEADSEPGDLVRRAAYEVDALELDRAAPGREEADRGLQQRGLAHPVPAQERDRLAGAHLQRDAEENRRRSVAGVNVGELEHG